MATGNTASGVQKYAANKNQNARDLTASRSVGSAAALAGGGPAAASSLDTPLALEAAAGPPPAPRLVVGPLTSLGPPRTAQRKRGKRRIRGARPRIGLPVAHGV